MSTFVLVHGAWHGRWCWGRLEAELRAQGHAVVVADLPVSDGSATFVDYRDAVLEDWPGASSVDVVVVGHSLGAMVVPLLAAERPVDTSVFLCPVVPNVGGMPWHDVPEMGAPGAYRTVTHADGSQTFDSLEEAVFTFYGTCDPADAAWAFERLRPQNSTSLWDRAYPLTELPPGRRVVIAGAHDRAITPAYVGAASSRLGVEPLEIDTDHSPFLSAPSTLADLLVTAASGPGTGSLDRG